MTEELKEALEAMRALWMEKPVDKSEEWDAAVLRVLQTFAFPEANDIEIELDEEPRDRDGEL